MKRISEDELKHLVGMTYPNLSEQDRDYLTGLNTGAESQLQADKEAVKASREKIANILRNYRSDIVNNHAYLAEVVADQIIKLISEV